MTLSDFCESTVGIVGLLVVGLLLLIAAITTATNVANTNFEARRKAAVEQGCLVLDGHIYCMGGTK